MAICFDKNYKISSYWKADWYWRAGLFSSLKNYSQNSLLPNSRPLIDEFFFYLKPITLAC
jgi:hypothetical protein